jgi:uncharacterized membrane protein
MPKSTTTDSESQDVFTYYYKGVRDVYRNTTRRAKLGFALAAIGTTMFVSGVYHSITHPIQSTYNQQGQYMFTKPTPEEQTSQNKSLGLQAAGTGLFIAGSFLIASTSKNKKS